MSSSILDKPIVLALNRVWQPIGHRTVKQAIVAMTGGADGVPPAVGLDIGYGCGVDGAWDFDHPLYVTPVAWPEWVALPVREFDMSIASAKMVVRVPTVLVATNFASMPVHSPKVSRQAIFHRDGGICQYTGERVGFADGNLDHVIPRDQGGHSSFENLVWSKKSVNSYKANRRPHEAGLRLLRQPKAPATVAVAATLREAKHPDWRHFLMRK
jgi:5-methylcytosine-specific restriction endonuclease McrA